MVLITYTTAILDIYHDTFILQLDGPSDVDIVNPVKMLTYLPFAITTSIINFTGTLHKYKPVPNWQDLPALFLAFILVQVTYLNSQIYYYENHQDDYINSMQKSYELCSEKIL